MKQIVLSNKQMKHLEELGLDTNDASLHYYEWIDDYGESGGDYCADPYGSNIKYHAYTLQDILEKLPITTKVEIDLDNDIPLYFISFVNHNIWNTSILDAAYQMLLWCIENNYIKTNKV